LAVVALSAAKEWGPPKARRVTSTNTITATPTNASLTNLGASALARGTSTNTAGSAKSPKPPKLPIIPLAKPLPVIVRGPYLQCGTTNSVVIRWRTDAPGPSVVRFGLSPANLNKTAASAGSLTEHVVLVRGLKPDTRYFYAIGANDCPILATLTNNVLAIRTTNGALAVGTTQRIQLAAVTNDTLLLSQRKNMIHIGWPQHTNVVNTSNSTVLVSTTNNSLLVVATNRMLVVTTTTNLSARASPKTFVVGTTNLTLVGGDTNTFFYTNPLIGTRPPVRVWVVGDPGTRKPEQKRVRDAYYRFTGDRRTDLWLMLGDNAYNAGTDAEYQGAIFQVYGELLRRSVLWPTLGNHDAGSADSPTQSGVYFDLFTLPTQGQAGGVMSGTEAYYSFDYANIHFICLDSSNSDRSTNGLMLRWLQADLGANRQDWCVAYCHHPPYTKGSHDSDLDKDSEGAMRDMRGKIVPVLEAGGVDLVLNGHSHAYERSYLLDGHYKYSSALEDAKNIISPTDGREDGWGVYRKSTLGPAPHSGTIYVVAGSGGQVSGGALLHPAMYAGLNIHGSLVLDFSGSKLDVSFIDTNSFVRDYFTVEKGVARPQWEWSDPAEEFVPWANTNIPARLLPLVHGNREGANLAAVTNATPLDQDFLLTLYDESTDLVQKTNLTWALVYTGDADVTTNFLYLLTRQHKGKEISLEEEDLLFETAQAIGFLAARYEAAFDFLKRHADPHRFQTNKLWLSARGPWSAGLLASCCIQSLGLSGRPEALEILTRLQTKRLPSGGEEDPEYIRFFTRDIERALNYHAAFQRLGLMAMQRQILTCQLPRPAIE
jgi:hypothetical protein